MNSVGFVGLGSIGAQMARRLLSRERALTVCDAAPQALRGFEGTGAVTTTNASDCAACDVVVVMVATDEQVEQVLLGRGQGFCRPAPRRIRPCWR